MLFQQLLLLYVIVAWTSTAQFQSYTGQGPFSSKASSRLSKPLVGEDGRIYTCSARNFFAFESNGSIAWALRLPFTCSIGSAPVNGGRGKIYLIAENRVLKINFVNVGTSLPTADVFFDPDKAEQGPGEIIGLAVSTMSSLVIISIKNQGLFAYLMRGQLLWSIGPVLSQFGYRLGCRKGITDCYFTSVPVIDQCEASIYIPNTAGELYSLSLRSPHYNWVQDLSSIDEYFTVTPGNNGHLFVTVPNKALVLALDVSAGNVLWQKSIGPLSTAESAPVVDSNGWVSVGSLDGYLYSISPTGDIKTYTKASTMDHVVQVSPFLDCSGYAVYFSQTATEGKVSRVIDGYTYVSAVRTKGVVFTLLVPATGAIYWSDGYPGEFSSLFFQSDLQHFVLDEGILLAFVTASRTGNSLPCRSEYQKLVSSCSQTRPKHKSIYTGNERTIMLFLLLETVVLIILAGLVRFCCIFWSKRKLQAQGLGNFLKTRRSLQLKKKEFERTITELQQKVAEEAVLRHEVLEELGDMVREKEGIERKLSTTYSLGRDGAGQRSKSLIPMYSGKTRSYSFQSARKESVTLFHTLSDTSSADSSSSSSERESSWSAREGKEPAAKEKAKAKAKDKAPAEAEIPSDDEAFVKDFRRSPSEPASSSKGYVSPMFMERGLKDEKLCDEVEAVESAQSSGTRSIWLKRRRNLSLTK